MPGTGRPAADAPVRRGFRLPTFSRNLLGVSLGFFCFDYFVYLLLYAGLEFTLSFHTHTRFNYDNMQQGRMYFYSGLIMIFVQGTFDG